MQDNNHDKSKEFVNWYAGNKDFAEKLYPDVTEIIKESFSEISSITYSKIIQQFPLNFYKRKKEVEFLFGIAKKKKLQIIIQQYKQLVFGFEKTIKNNLESARIEFIEKYGVEIAGNLINECIDEFKENDEVKIFENAILSVREELLEQLNYWELEYSKIDTTFAHVEEGKEVEIIIKDEVNGTPCIEFDNLFGADIRRKNEVWQYMKLLGMIDSEGKYLLGGERAIIRAFVMVMKKNGRFTPTADEGFLIRVVGLKLLGDNKLRVRPSKQIHAKQNEIVTFLNNQETKNSSFINVG